MYPQKFTLRKFLFPGFLTKTAFPYEYGFAGFGIFIVVFIKYFTPVLSGNEWVNLVGPRKILDPSFLQNDWTMGLTFMHRHFFDLVLAPLWVPFDALGVALAGRIVVWVLLLVALAAFARAIRTPWWAFLAGSIFWIYCRQSLIAEEWILGGVESKVFSYAFLFAALTSLFRQRDRLAGVLIGVAIGFHPIVGGYAFLASLGAMVVCRRDFGVRRAVNFFAYALPFLVLTGIVAVIYKGMGVPADPAEVHRLSVLFRAPHHLDPNLFLSVKNFIYLNLTFLCAIEMLIQHRDRGVGLFLVSFLAALYAIFLMGLIASYFGLTGFLQTYPFRLAPVFVLLFFAWSSPVYLSQRWHGSVRNRLLIAVIFLVVMGLAQKEYIYFHIKRDSVLFPRRWNHFFKSTKDDDFLAACRWIREHTDPASIFIVPPWEPRFWLSAERGAVVMYKYCPPNNNIVGWHRRMRDLNGGRDFKTRGEEIKDSLRENWSNLPVARLKKIRDDYDAQYYFSLRERKDLRQQLVYAHGKAHLYNIQQL